MMIQKFIEKFNSDKNQLETIFSQKHPDDYADILKVVLQILHEEEEDSSPNPLRIHKIDDGDYQGTLVFVIGGSGYQPSDYWYVKVGYGSCSGCDTLENIRRYSEEKPTPDQVKDYMTLALHIVQGLKKMGDDE